MNPKNKRPQISILLDQIDLDSQNPRLSEENQGKNQLETLRVLYRNFNLEELAFSMTENGYFEEEPIVVIPQNLPKNFNKSGDTNKLEEKLEDFTNEKKLKYTVVEGNRRIATAKLLLRDIFRKEVLDDEEDFPRPKNNTIKADLEVIPSIVYFNRSDISPYLGVRHISGILKWEAYAKARYIAKRVEELKEKGKKVSESIEIVQKKVGDRSDVIRKQFICYQVVEQADEDLGFPVNAITDRFSLLQLALNSKPIRDFIGAPSYREADFKNKRFIPKSKLDNLEKLLTWIYGKPPEIRPIITDSRKISSRLSPILKSKEATNHFLKYGSLEEAFERSDGERDYLDKKIRDALSNIKQALTVAYKHRDKEIISQIDELLEAVKELKSMVLR